MWTGLLGTFLLLTSIAANAQAPAATPPATDLGVSLDRIRAELKKDATTSLLRQADIPADFKIQILEQQKIDDLLAKIDFGKPGPVPAGGLAMYEQQRRLFNPVDRPLAQPYAAYSGAEFLTVALENLLGRYVGEPLVRKAVDARRAAAEREAREDVDAAIAAYCARRPDRADIALCARRAP